MILKYFQPETGKMKTLKFVPVHYTNPGGNLLDAFGNYYGRFQNAEDSKHQEGIDGVNTK